MEYRGYDSVGVATKSNSDILVKKGVGRVVEVNTKVQLDNLPGMVGIGHTRWATHGEVTDKNAHPHPSNSGKIAIVHNGIVENYEEAKVANYMKNENLEIFVDIFTGSKNFTVHTMDFTNEYIKINSDYRS